MPRVSVIIPTYNRAAMIEQAIESVLVQTFRDYEIVVVDDGSTDGTRQGLMRYQNRIRYLYQDNQERSIARNNGVAASIGEYLVFLDSDDLLLPNMLGSLIAALNSRLEMGLIAGGYQYVNEICQVLRKVRPWLHNPSITLETLLSFGLTPTNAVMVHRDWFERVGGFDPTHTGAEDMDFWYRLSLEGCGMGWERSIVCQYRIHNSNFTNNVKKNHAAFFTVLDSLFARTDLPSDIFKRKQELYTQLRLGEIGRLFTAGELEDAKAMLKDAFVLDPMLSQDNNRLTIAIVDWQKSVWVKDRSRFLDSVFGNLPPEIASAKFRMSVLSSCLKANFYDAYEEDDALAVRKLWMEIVRREPSWLMNRGGWSILLQSLGIKTRKTQSHLSQQLKN